MSDLSADDARSESRLKQIHDYIRHTLQLFLGWFAFFAGINYVALGWLATGTNHAAPSVAIAVGANFIVRNLLGIVRTIFVDRALKDLARFTVPVH